MNGNPHYSADNGFASAAAGRGITEALQEHLNVIIRDENLEIAFNNDYYQTEIEDLVEDKEQLEQQKTERQNAIKETSKELETKKVELAEFNVKLESPVELLETTEGSRILEINDKIDEKISDLETKKAEKIKLEVDLEAPTQVELDVLTTDGAVHHSSKHWFSKLRQGVSGILQRLPKIILAIFGTVVLLFLFGYLYLFYVSAGEKTVKSGEDMDLTALIDYKALDRSWKSTEYRNRTGDEDPRDWLILMFPSIFIFLVIATHLSEENKKWRHFWAFLIAAIIIEGTIGWRIANTIVKEQDLIGDPEPFILLFGLFALLGLGTSVMLGFGLSFILGLWENIRPQHDKSKQLEMQIRAEKNEKLVELSVLNTELQNLEEGLTRLDEEKRTYTESLLKTYRHPIEAQIAGLDAEIQSIQDGIKLLNEQVDSLQMEIDRCESEITTHLKGQRERVLDIKKMEAQANEFVTGWCRYISQCRSDLQPQEISSQILEIQELKEEVLEKFKTTLNSV